MIKVDLYTKTGKSKSGVELPEALFSLPWNESLVHQVVEGINSNERKGNAKTKGRSEVSGGGRKPFKQKGTGRARAGSIRSPIWRGGGITFGPDGVKDYGKSINKKMRTKAFFTVLSKKVRDNSLNFINEIKIDKPSTKDAYSIIQKICDENKGKKNICTIVSSTNDNVIKKSFGNIKGVTFLTLDTFNTKDAFKSRSIFFINPEETLTHLNKRAEKIVGGGDEVVVDKKESNNKDKK